MLFDKYRVMIYLYLKSIDSIIVKFFYKIFDNRYVTKVTGYLKYFFWGEIITYSFFKHYITNKDDLYLDFSIKKPIL